MWDRLGGSAESGPPGDGFEETPLTWVWACLVGLCLAWMFIGTPILFTVAVLYDLDVLRDPFGPPHPLGLDLIYWVPILFLLGLGGTQAFAALAELARRPKSSTWTPPYRSPARGGPPTVGPAPSEPE